MTRSLLKFRYKLLVFSISVSKTLLGFYFFLLEISECRELIRCSYDGSVPTRPRTATTTTTCRPDVFLPTGNQPVQIHSPQMKLVVERGDEVFLPCRVLNLGQNQILWRHERTILAGSNITSTSHSRVQLLSDFTLHLSDVNDSDDGVYECIVTTWPPVKLSHNLMIRGPTSPTLNIEPDTGSIVVTEGDSVQIGCIPGGNPIPRITWSKRNGTIPQDRRAALTQTSLTIYNVSPRDAGLYQCTADNGFDRPASGTIYVRVLYAPEVRTPHRIVHGGVKYKTTLMCSAHADPLPEVEWSFGQKPVSLSHRIRAESRGSEHYLIFSTIRESDFGLYICSANNSFGFDLRFVELSGVSNPPVVTRWETSSCEQSRNAVLDSESTKTMMTSQNSNQESSKKMGCTVHVKLYWAVECYSPLIDYRLIFRSVKTDQDQLVNSFNEDRVLPWTELNIPADKAFAFIHTKSFTIHGLTAGKTLEAALRARNKYGTSHLSPVFHFSTVPDSSYRVHELKDLFPNVPEPGSSNTEETENEEDYYYDTPSSANSNLGFTWIPGFIRLHYLLVLFCLT